MRTTFNVSASRRKPTRRGIAASVLAVAVLAAACGDDATSSSDTTAAPVATTGAETTTATTAAQSTTTAAAAKKSPLKLMVLADQSGPVSSDQKYACDIAKAWASTVNAKGGVADHPVSIDCTDTGGDPAKGTAAAQSVAGKPEYAAAVLVDTAGETAVGPVLSGAKLPTTGVVYNPTVAGKLPYIYQVTTSFPAVSNEQGVSAKALGLKKVGRLACAETASCAAAEPLFKAAAEGLGLEYIGQLQVAGDAPNYTAECLEFVNRGAEFVQLSLGTAVAIRVSDECSLQGYTGWFGASAGTVSPVLYKTPKLRLTGGLNAFPWFVDAAPVKAYRDAMKASSIEEKVWANPTATGVWASLELLAKGLTNNAAKLADPVTREDVVASYATVSAETLGGLLSEPLTFAADGISKPLKCFWLYTAPGDGTVKGEFTPTCDPLAKT